PPQSSERPGAAQRRSKPAPRRSSHKSLGALDDELRPGAHFLIDPPDVLAEDADADQLDASKEGDQDDHGRIAPDDRPAHQFIKQIDAADEKRESGYDEPQPGAQREGIGGKTENPVEADPQRS